MIRTLMRMVPTVVLFAALAAMAADRQPAVTKAGGGEPDWADVLKARWGLVMERDLRNPVFEGATPAGIFRRAKADKPVIFTPVIALGLETPTRGGWYAVDAKTSRPAGDERSELWSYAYKQPADQQKSLEFTLPPLKTGSPAFDPGDHAFGFWISNDEFKDGGVYTQPALVAARNQRLGKQPYKAMIYPDRDPKTGRLVPDSYLIGWEYSTNDDFQDVVTRVENVHLLASEPAVSGVVAADAQVKKLAGGFQFTEGPAWSMREKALYFSDIPAAQIVRWANDKAAVANKESGSSNGLMFDRDGLLVRCEHGGRRVSRGEPTQPGKTLAERHEGRRLNSPNDLWIDTSGGIYFTDPRYGGRDDLELDKEAVYYLTADGALTRIIDDLVRPNGIALSPDGKRLYVVDNGDNKLYRYAVTGPGKVGKGELIAGVIGPDGMTVDQDGRLYITAVYGVWVLDANGNWLGLIETPEQPANCTFGGEDWSTLFITARTSLYAVPTRTRGWHIHLDGPRDK